MNIASDVTILYISDTETQSKSLSSSQCIPLATYVMKKGQSLKNTNTPSNIPTNAAYTTKYMVLMNDVLPMSLYMV